MDLADKLMQFEKPIDLLMVIISINLYLNYLPLLILSFVRKAVYRISNFDLKACFSAKNRMCSLFVFETTDSAITPQKFFNLQIVIIY